MKIIEMKKIIKSTKFDQILERLDKIDARLDNLVSNNNLKE